MMEQAQQAHPILSPPLSAVLRAGTLSPGTRYAPSPTVKSLKRILEQQQKKGVLLTPLERNIRSINYQYSLLFKNHHLHHQHQHSPDSSRSTTTVQISDSQPPSQQQEQWAINTTTASRIKRWFTLNWSPKSLPESSRNITTTTATADVGADQQNLIAADPDSFSKPKFPLVLCHGLLGFDVLGPAALGLTYFRGVREALEERGVEVYVAKVPACASIEERAKTLAQFIETRLPGQTVNLIGHSMGGLDSRFMITHLRPTSFKVASLTTIGTPHRGSAFADYLLLDILGRQHHSKFLQISKSLGLPGGGKAFVELTSEQMAVFNQNTPDLHGISYFSYAAVCEPSFASPFRLSWGVVYEREGPNDGLVSVASAQWGSYLGTLHNVNHAELVGWVEPWKTSSSKKHLANLHLDDQDQQHQKQKQKQQQQQQQDLSRLMDPDKPHTHEFQVVPFYLQVVDSLAKKGF
ncbi:hypothetical protein PGT21_014402 [Puccinia graminis f. sp. tritici]|uniref:GPI inositol-deacylase n=1 Tax=Puccinia graminis f. sp. tritici TaxID=56615 RepID=A0A5B0NCH5_PUCGR|nr:hypothetical protein PGT21_014402 [Puccinia graminis f. sp. tritici]